MKPFTPKSFVHHLPGLILVLFTLGVYLYTLAPGLTWANAGSDGGDLLTAAFTGGIAHPTGYPLYLVLARLFQSIPIGSLAYRTNLMSAVAMTLAVVLIYDLVTRSLSQARIIQTWPAGMIAGFSFGLAPVVWSQAVITEVYALQALLTALIVYLYTEPVRTKIKRPYLDRLRGLMLGIAMSNHITTLFLILPALILGVFPGDDDKENTLQVAKFWRRRLKYSAVSLRRQLTWFGIGLAFYLILPLRAMTNPPVNWGNPVTLERFWWLVSGQLYQSYYLQLGLADGWGNVQAWAALFLQQFGVVGLVFGSIGLALFFIPSRLYRLTIWIGIVYSAFALLYASEDSYLYLIPVYLVFAIWIGLGAGNLMSRFALLANPVRLGMGILLIGYFIFHSLGFFDQVDASHDLRAESFGREILETAPDDALIFAKGDQAVFTLWYFHFALQKRPDLVVIAEDLLHFDWYQENLRSVYPSLVVPGPFPWPETITSANPLRAVCYVQYIDRTEMDCVEPLMAP